MFDATANRLVKAPVNITAHLLDRLGLSANQVTLTGFALGLCAFPLLATQHYLAALLFIGLNRVCDGLDGALARRQGVSDAGGFLDISLDFVFYSLVPFGFVVADPAGNAIAGAFLIFSFVGSGSSFLAFAVMAGKRGIDNPVYQNKSLYYMSGLTEGSETIGCFILCCLFPEYFSVIAWGFGAACWFTTLTRIYSGYQTLSQAPVKREDQSR